MKTLAALLLLLAPVVAHAQPAQQRANCAQNEARFPALIGRPQAEVEAALRAMPGIGVLRALAPNAPATTDYRGNRATLTIVDGRVRSIVCG